MQYADFEGVRYSVILCVSDRGLITKLRKGSKTRSPYLHRPQKRVVAKVRVLPPNNNGDAYKQNKTRISIRALNQRFST